MSSGQLWSLLPHVRQVTINADRCQGIAAVSVHRQADNVMQMYEQGQWLRPMQGNFWNRLLWQKEAGGIRLIQQRRGSSEQVPLVFFAEGALLSTPYVCGMDTYEASIDCNGDGFCLHWSVNGPNKHMILVHQYSQ